MKKLFLATHVAALCLSFQLYAELKLSDFETETKQNCLGWDWYYYSDARDGGTSEIFNSTMKPDYSYEDFKSSDSGYNSKKCGKIVYRHGGMNPCGLENSYQPFVGMGTEITKPATETDLRALQFIRFSAKSSNHKTPVLVDIMFSLKSDNNNELQTGYFEYKILIDTTWNIYTVPVQEMDERMLLVSSKDHPVDYCLQHAMKIEWYIERQHSKIPDTLCCLSIDDIYLVGIDSLPRNPAVYTIAPIRKVTVHPTEIEHMYRYDLLGKCAINTTPVRVPGMFIKKSNKILQIHYR